MTADSPEMILRRQLVDYAQQLDSSGLSAGKSGNLSLRSDDTILITPSAVAYDTLQPEHIVALRTNGEPLPGEQLQASSEWRFHCDLYRSRADIHAIVHAHSPACTALACTGRGIPAFHYMVAIAGGRQIPLADYALFGTAELSANIVSAISDLQACLLANHGMLAVGGSLDRAFNLAREVEGLAAQYVLALQIGGVKVLNDRQMDAVIERFKHYGQRH